MNDTQVVTLRMPRELKRRLDREAKYQGVSLNQLANYLVNSQLTHMESVSILESRIEKKSIPTLKRKARIILSKVPDRNVPSWDKIDSWFLASGKRKSDIGFNSERKRVPVSLKLDTKRAAFTSG